MTTINANQNNNAYLKKNTTSNPVEIKVIKTTDPAYKKFIDYDSYQKTNMENMKDVFYSKKDPEYVQVNEQLQKVESVDNASPEMKDKYLTKEQKEAISKEKERLIKEKEAIKSKYKKEFNGLIKTEEGRQSLKKSYYDELDKMIKGSLEGAQISVNREKLATELKSKLKKPVQLTPGEALDKAKRKAIKQKFEQIAKEKYGVNAHYSSKELLKAFWANKALEKITKAGFDLKGLNIRMTTAGDNAFLPIHQEKVNGKSTIGAVDGVTFSYTPNIYLRKNMPKNLSQIDWGHLSWMSSGFQSTQKPDHAPVHEVGHYLNYEEIKKTKDFDKKDIIFTLNEKTKSFLKENVSGYSPNCQGDAVAEIFTGILDGKSYNKETMQFYKSMNGPTNKKFEKIIAENAKRNTPPKPKFAFDDLSVPTYRELNTKLNNVLTSVAGMTQRALTTDDIPRVRALSNIGNINNIGNIAKTSDAMKLDKLSKMLKR